MKSSPLKIAPAPHVIKEVLRINVTREDIRRGIPRYKHACPIARAARRIKGLRNLSILVTRKTISVEGHRFRLPKPAQQFVLDFDNLRAPVQGPFSFLVSRKVV